jgi:hypothetical protein
MKRAENSNFKNTIEDLRHVIEIQIMHNSKRKFSFINKIASIIFFPLEQLLSISF